MLHPLPQRNCRALPRSLACRLDVARSVSARGWQQVLLVGGLVVRLLQATEWEVWGVRAGGSWNWLTPREGGGVTRRVPRVAQHAVRASCCGFSGAGRGVQRRLAGADTLLAGLLQVQVQRAAGAAHQAGLWG